MGRRDKRRQKVLAAGRNVRLSDAIGLLEAEGFDCRIGGNGHWRCCHAESGILVGFAGPHGREGYLLPAYVKRLREALAAVDQWREDGNEPA
ncbi:MAG: hypothetical protein HUU35_15165 [Armatimonadetes bacterium]|nr:hypothetical protein [Armatimonadota bacterium]